MAAALSSTLTFWLLAGGMVAVALLFVLPRLVGRRGETRGRSRDALNADVYRGELADLEAERSAGTLAEADYARARADLERRLLEDVAPGEPAPRLPERVAPAAWGLGIALPVAAFALYHWFGTPAAIVTVPATEASSPVAAQGGGDFRAQLVAHLASSPRDGRGWVALARLDMSEDRFDDAAKHFARAIEVSEKVARDPGVLCEYADALGMTQGGRLEGEPGMLIARALALDPAHPKALEMAGSAAYERRDFRAAAQHWRTLLAQFMPGTPAHTELTAAIQRAERLGAMMLPPAAPGS